MVISMATRKVTVTLDETQLDQIRSLVQAGSTPSVSAFVQHAVAVALDDVVGWGAMLAEALRQTGGPLSDDERAWADDVLSSPARAYCRIHSYLITIRLNAVPPMQAIRNALAGHAWTPLRALTPA